jgi:hypothetical protein
VVCKTQCLNIPKLVMSSQVRVVCESFATVMPHGARASGGLRIIYFWWEPKKQFWLFTLYDKDELDDLSPKEKTVLKTLLKQELEERK